MPSSVKLKPSGSTIANIHMVSLVLAVPQRFSPLAALQHRTILVVLSAWLRRAGWALPNSEALQTALPMGLALPTSPRQALQTELALQMLPREELQTELPTELPMSSREQLQTVLPMGLLSTAT